MSKAYEYKIVYGSQETLEREIPDLTEGGWVLHGGLLALVVDGNIRYSQALIKEFEIRGPWG